MIPKALNDHLHRLAGKTPPPDPADAGKTKVSRRDLEKAAVFARLLANEDFSMVFLPHLEEGARRTLAAKNSVSGSEIDLRLAHNEWDFCAKMGLDMANFIMGVEQVSAVERAAAEKSIEGTANSAKMPD